MENVEKIRVIYKKVDQKPKVIEIDNTLESKQKLVHGLIEVCDYKFGTLVICNDEGRLMDLKPNLDVGYEFIVGDCLIVGDDYENADFKSLTDEQIKLCLKDIYENSSEFIKSNDMEIQL